MKNPQHIIELLTTYLEGECTFEEKKTILEWVNSDPDNKQFFFEFKKARNLSFQGGKSTTDKMWTKVNGTIKRNNRFDYKMFYRIAATLVIAIGIGITSSILFGKFNNSVTEIVYNETIVPYGSKAELILSDGTLVKLNAGSRLKYPSAFNDTTRTVFLEGEAFFEVVTNKKKPFKVTTNDAIITAYGTEFNVKAYAEEPVVTATLVEGIITVQPKNAPGHEVTLTPNEHAVIQKEVAKTSIKNASGQESGNTEEQATKKTDVINYNQLDVKSKINTDRYTSWKDNVWIIENESFESISKKLERRFDISISFADEELKGLRFTGKILNEPLEQVLKYMGLTAPLKHKIKGRDVEFYLDTSITDYDKLYVN